MIGPRATALALLALASAACGGSNGSGPSIPPATCTMGMLALLGDLDGQPVDASTAFSGWAFQQATTPHTLDLPFDGSLLHLEWTMLLPAGRFDVASGRVVMPATAPHAGETICGATGRVKYEDFSTNGTDYVFTLTDLSLGPTCPGASLEGSLAGCARAVPPI
jgi:hypothetical protein